MNLCHLPSVTLVTPPLHRKPVLRIPSEGGQGQAATQGAFVGVTAWWSLLLQVNSEFTVQEFSPPSRPHLMRSQLPDRAADQGDGPQSLFAPTGISHTASTLPAPGLHLL